ncbi:MAG: SUMF1/EgtB/PvdO family nonheme iron enzyme [Bacteroidales bacterium]|nr:SUMF1/EgtB/PvdO family nonheme iron enzyme [Bacteroidales bacterium]
MKKIYIVLIAFALGVALTLALDTVYVRSSQDNSCMSCHVHPDAEASWKQSVHHNGSTGTTTGCAECHLPPEGSSARFFAKMKLGGRDLFSYIFKNKENINWEAKRELQYAGKIVFNESCEKCHENLLPKGVSDDAITAHLYYEENAEKLNLQCISCHLDAGHVIPGYSHSKMNLAPQKKEGKIHEAPATIASFADFEETIPGTAESIVMKAIPGGTFLMGSNENEPLRRDDEGPVRKVTVSSFFMAETEITWDQFWAFYGETMSEGRTPPSKIYANNSRPDVDAVSGPTPPYGAPDQGWGAGSRPAITMQHYAAETFCQWLSLKTGHKYRLPTEAEWEYAVRGGTDTPYWFEGSPKKYSDEGFWRKFSSADTTIIASCAIYSANSGNRTGEPASVAANPFGLKNMLGNVMEYCSDWYAADAYSQMADGAVDPKGPATGTEYVVRGGYYASDAKELRCAARAHTETARWLTTDPQNPKSIWWYSDIKGIGFRVVCEVPEGIY